MKHQKIEIIYGNIKFICFEFLNYINKIKLTTKRTSLLPKHKTAWYLNSCGPSGPPYSCLFWWLLLMATPLNSYSFCNVYNSVWVITWLRLFSDNCIVYKNKKNVSEKNSVFIVIEPMKISFLIFFIKNSFSWGRSSKWNWILRVFKEYFLIV